jgi:hypothetical protein
MNKKGKYVILNGNTDGITLYSVLPRICIASLIVLELTNLLYST